MDHGQSESFNMNLIRTLPGYYELNGVLHLRTGSEQGRSTASEATDTLLFGPLLALHFQWTVSIQLAQVKFPRSISPRRHFPHFQNHFRFSMTLSLDSISRLTNKVFPPPENGETHEDLSYIFEQSDPTVDPEDENPELTNEVLFFHHIAVDGEPETYRKTVEMVRKNRISPTVSVSRA